MEEVILRPKIPVIVGYDARNKHVAANPDTFFIYDDYDEWGRSRQFKIYFEGKELLGCSASFATDEHLHWLGGILLERFKREIVGARLQTKQKFQTEIKTLLGL